MQLIFDDKYFEDKTLDQPLSEYTASLPLSDFNGTHGSLI